MTPNQKPRIEWIEGLVDLFNTPFPHEQGDPRKLGFQLGRQILALYIIEMLLKYALDKHGTSHGSHHNLHQLFRQLPRPKRRAVERKYVEIMNSEREWAWDIARTADELLEYLGQNPITDTRYFWEENRTRIREYGSILFMPDALRILLFSLFIALHQYPSKPPTKRYDTRFISLAESLQDEPKTHGKS